MFYVIYLNLSQIFYPKCYLNSLIYHYYSMRMVCYLSLNKVDTMVCYYCYLTMDEMGCLIYHDLRKKHHQMMVHLAHIYHYCYLDQVVLDKDYHFFVYHSNLNKMVDYHLTLSDKMDNFHCYHMQVVLLVDCWLFKK